MTRYLNKIIIPEKSELLAEECGIHFGDGYMKIRKDGWGVHYDYTISSDIEEDSTYTKYVENLIKILYGLNASYKTVRNKRDFHLLYSSKELINFKLKIGIPLSPKENLIIPKWIKEEKTFCLAFLRGLYDTDGCLMFKLKSTKSKLHSYPCIYLSLKDKTLINEVA